MYVLNLMTTSVYHEKLTSTIKSSCLQLCSDILFGLEVVKELPGSTVDLNDLPNQATVNLLLKVENQSSKYQMIKLLLGSLVFSNYSSSFGSSG